MEFERSTQAKSWIFNRESLDACREQALRGDDCIDAKKSLFPERVQKFASGFHELYQSNKHGNFPTTSLPPAELTPSDQETLVHFHAYQLQTLIGPTAILYDLRTSETVLHTAIMLFRRFYLSNSVAEISPRKMSVACALFSSKLEGEKVEIGLLSHASAIIQSRVRDSPYCCTELRAVSILEIENAELMLMEGLNYEFCCHHTSTVIRDIVPELPASRSVDERNPTADLREGRSPRATPDFMFEDEFLLQRSLDVAKRALIFTDAPFLYSPEHTAFAVIAIASASVTPKGDMGKDLRGFLATWFPGKTQDELRRFARCVREIICMLVDSPTMDLRPTYGRAGEIVAQRGEELHRVIGLVSTLRMLRRMKRCEPRLLVKKRSAVELDFTPPRFGSKFVKVTPTAKRSRTHC